MAHLKRTRPQGNEGVWMPDLVELLEHFATDALGLELNSRIECASQLPVNHRRLLTEVDKCPSSWVAWHTDRGPATLRASYDEAQSLHTRAHVMCIDWWIDAEHHEGFFHCYPKFNRDWIIGPGRP